MLRSRKTATLLLFSIVLLASSAEAERGAGLQTRPGFGARLSSWLRGQERRASAAALTAKAPRRHQLAAKFFHGGRHLTVGVRQAIRRSPIGKNTLWATSSIALGSAEFHAAGQVSKLSRLGRGLRILGVGAGIGLAATAAHDLTRAGNTVERLDAAGDLAWGIEGATALAAPHTLGTLAQGVGIVGGICQTVAGCRRIIQGVRERDRSKVKLGALDVAGGLTWLAWDVSGFSNPYFLGAYGGIMVAREAYANRDALKAMGKRAADKVSCAYGRCKTQLQKGASWIREKTGAPRFRLLSATRSPAP